MIMLNKPEYALIRQAGISKCRELLNQLTIVKQDKTQRPESRPVYKPDFMEGFIQNFILYRNIAAANLGLRVSKNKKTGVEKGWIFIITLAFLPFRRI